MSKLTITIKNNFDGLRIIFSSDNKDKLVGIVLVKNRRIDLLLMNKLLAMDLNSIGIYHKNLMIEIFEDIKKMVSDLDLNKRWNISFDKDIK